MARIKEQKDKIDRPITMDDFRDAIKNISKSVGKEQLAKYQAWMNEFGSA